MDVGRIFDGISELMTNAGLEDALNADLTSANAQSLLEAVDLDPTNPELLDNLPISDLQQHLDNLGIDPAAMAEGDIPEVITSLMDDTGPTAGS